MFNTILKYVSNAVIGMCIGGFIDYFAHTEYIFAVIAAAVGVVVSFFVKTK